MRIVDARISTPTRIRTCRRTLSKRARGEKIFRDVASGAVDSRRGLAESH
jgi:hypothetical protein